MKRWLKRIVATIGVGLTWAAVWGIFGFPGSQHGVV